MAFMVVVTEAVTVVTRDKHSILYFVNFHPPIQTIKLLYTSTCSILVFVFCFNCRRTTLAFHLVGVSSNFIEALNALCHLHLRVDVEHRSVQLSIAEVVVVIVCGAKIENLGVASVLLQQVLFQVHFSKH